MGKKVFSFLAVLVLAVCVLFGCGAEGLPSASATAAVNYVRVAVVDKDSNVLFDEEVSTYSSTLDKVLQEQSIPFTISGGFVTSVYNIENAADWSYCWMFYTNAAGMTDGTYPYTYDGTAYGSASMGLSELAIKDGATYVIVCVVF